MKKRSLAILLTAVLSLSSFSVIARADGTDVSLRDKAGIVPGNILYSLDKLAEKIQLVFTFSDAGKAELLANLAQERLGESQILLDKGDTEAEKETLEAADEAMNEAAEVASEAAKETKDSDSDSKITKVQKTLENLVKVDDQFQGILDKIKAGNTDNIKDIIAEVTDKNAARKLAVAEMVDARHALNSAREALNKAKESGDETALAKAQEDYKKAQLTFQEAFNDKQAVVNKNGKGQKDFSKKNEQSEAAVTAPTSTSTATTAATETVVQSTATQAVADTTENLTVQSIEDANVKKSSELKNEKTNKKENNGVGNAYGKEKNAEKPSKDKK